MPPSIRFNGDQLDYYIGGTINFTLKQSPMLDEMTKKGRVEFNKPAEQYRRTYFIGSKKVRTLGRFQPLDQFRGENDGKRVEAVIPMSEYVISDIFDGQELSRTGGQWAVRDLKKTALRKLNQDLRNVLQEEILLGDGAASGSNVETGGTGRRWYGIMSVLNTTPTTGTLYGLSRSAVAGFQHEYVDGATAGTLNSFASDIWEVISLVRANCSHDWDEGQSEPDLIVFTKANWVLFQNKYLAQNVQVSVDDPGRKVKHFDGAMWHWDENLTAANVLVLNTSTWSLWSPDSKLYKVRTIDEHPNYSIGNQVRDIQVQGSLICWAPRNNGRIYNAS